MVEAARSMRARSRAGSGGWARIVTLAIEALRCGSFSRFHIRASASVIRRSARTSRSRSATAQRYPGGYSDRRGCLNSLSSGHDSRSRTRSIVRVAWAPSPLGRSISRTKLASAPTLKVGTPQVPCSATVALVLLADRLERLARGDRGEHGVGVDPDGLERGAHRVGVAQVATVVVPEGEERLVRVEEPLGLLVPHHDAGLERQQAGLVLRVVPHVGLAFGHVDLAEGERHEGDVPVGTGAEAGDHVLMGVAGERAAVVPGHGEGGAGVCGHATGPTAGAAGAFRAGAAQAWGARPGWPRGRARRPRARRRPRRTRGGCARSTGWTPPRSAIA